MCREAIRPLRPPAAERIVTFPSAQPPILLVVVDTEEEFDWSADFDRRHTSIAALREIHLVQRVFDQFEIRPVYVVDFPVASQPAGATLLRELQAAGKAEIGAHLHPWVSPPYVEEVNRRNSYPGNLSPDLERAKLRALAETIEQGIGVRPRVYKAGRYGLGPNSPAILEEEGFEVDLSICPAFDWREDGGPDYSSFPPEPFWFGARGRLLAVPSSAAFVPSDGLAADLPIKLSPEGYGAQEHKLLTRTLLERGVRSFTFMFHSPSLKPGCTPYVRTRFQLVRFLDGCRRYFDFFLGELGGVSMTAMELKRCILHERPAASRPASSSSGGTT